MPRRHDVLTSAMDEASRRGWPHEVLRAGERVARRPPQTLGPEHPAFARLLTWEHPAAFRTLLPSATIAGHDPLVFADDGRVLLESTFDLEQLERSPSLEARLWPYRRHRGRHLALVGPWSHNHFHWFLDLLPRLALLPVGEEPGADVIVPRTVTPLQRDSLVLAGVSADRITPLPRLPLRLDELWFPSMTGRTTGNPPRWVVDWLRDRLAPATPDRTGRLYVSRADAGSRRIVNEDAVAAELATRGFETILPGQLPLDEQLRRFAAAEAVVGAHGAGLVGLFAAHRATVVELFGDDYVNGCFFALSEAAGHDYWYLVGAADGTSDLHVDLPALRRTLDAAGLS